MSESRFFPMMCRKCGWIGSSEHAEGGIPIADTGEFSELLCPKCANCKGIETVLREVPEMSEQINITEARELFAKTTPGEWLHVAEQPESDEFSDVPDEQHYVSLYEDDACDSIAWTGASLRSSEDAAWIARAQNQYPAMLDELERLRVQVAQQQSELGEYWRAAVAIESLDEAVSGKGLDDLHSIRTGNSYSQVGPSVAEMLQNQRDELQKEVERLRAEAKCTIEAIGGDAAELDVAVEDRVHLDRMVSEAKAQKDDEVERLRATIKEIASIGVVRGEDILGGRWVRKDEIDGVTKQSSSR